MSIFSKFLSLQNGVSRTVDLSTNTLSVLGLQINSATGGGNFTQAAHSATSSYSVIWPQSQAGGSGFVLSNDGAGNLSWVSGSSGSVTSVALADGSTSPIYSISGSPVTSTGTLTFSLNTQSANMVFAGPASGSAAQPSFRGLVSADIPNNAANTTGTASNITATSNSTLTSLTALTSASSLASVGTITSGVWQGTAVGVLFGGTGASSAAAGFANLSPLTTAGDIIYENNTPAPARLPIGSSGQVLTVSAGLPSWQTLATSANTALSNLASVAINTSLLPGTSNSINLGSASFIWNTLWASSLAFPSGPSVNLSAGQDFDSAGSISLDWQNRLLEDSGQNTSVDYGNRLLKDASGGTQLSWSTSGVEINSASLNLNSNKIVNLATPTNPADAANKSYVDSLINGISWKNHAQAISTSALPSNTYSNGSSGIGATLTATANAALVVDGYTVLVNDRIVVAGEATAANNGIYVVTATGSGSAPYILTRSLDMDIGTQFPNAAVWIDNGTANANTAWVQTVVGSITVGTTSISFSKFASATPYMFTNGLQQVGQTVSILVSDTSLTTSGSGVQVHLATGGALSTSSGVKVNVDNSTIDINGSNQIEVKSAGITSTQLASASVTAAKLGSVTDGITLDQSGSGSTLEIKSGGVGTTQLASASVTAAKLGTITDGVTLDQAGSGSTLEIKNAGVSATQLATGAFDQVTITGGAGTAASVAQAPALKRSLVAGQSFAANTSFAVRWGLAANSESPNRVYAADPNTASFDLFYVIGMASSGTSVTAGQTITVTSLGSFNLSSSDTAFASGTDGSPVFLASSGAFTLTAPTTAGQAITRIGIVQMRSATAASNIIDVAPQVVGVN